MFIKTKKYCSNICKKEGIRKSMKERWKTEKFREKIRLNYRPPRTIFKEGHNMNKGANNPMHGKIRELHPNWKGGKTISFEGYNRVLCPKHPYHKHNYVQEHRLYVEKFIGRFLEKEETIHHLNEIKIDNRIDNLMVFQSNSEHIKWHIKLKRYGYLTNPMSRQINMRWKDLEELDKRLGRQRDGIKID